jgi:acyl carrier protein
MSPVTFEQVVEVIEEQNGILDRKKIKPESRLTEDLELDSLDKVELVMALEERFELIISDEDADRCVTVGDVMNLLSTIQ